MEQKKFELTNDIIISFGHPADILPTHVQTRCGKLVAFMARKAA